MKVSVAGHVAAAGTLLLDGKARRWGLAILALDHLALSGAGCFPHAQWLGPVTTRLPTTKTSTSADPIPDMVLSFDDGPDPDVTPQVAHLLEDRGLRATFFMIGERVERHPELVSSLHDAGHRIENHTHTHPSSFAFSFLPRLAREIGDCQRTIERVTGRAPAYFRAPAGMRNPLLECALARQGLRLASWTRRGYDTANGNSGQVLNRLDRGLSRGDILLLHDGNAARTPRGQPVCLEVLPRLLDRLQEAGLRAGPMPEPAALGLS